MSYFGPRTGNLDEQKKGSGPGLMVADFFKSEWLLPVEPKPSTNDFGLPLIKQIEKRAQFAVHFLGRKSFARIDCIRIPFIAVASWSLFDQWYSTGRD